ncbi:MAG: class I SAM-dependent methyltransferase [Nanoarchaeota archaeon]|nr:class I SAM-dependent methyltransferase [Nanoarchaeota archaeon]
MDYDNLAPGYNELHGEEQEAKMRIIRPYVKGKTLDVGCGTGLSSQGLNDVMGIDPSEGMLKHADIPTVKGKAEDLPFENDSFDTVISVTAFHNFHEPEKALEEMKRVCKGDIVISLLRKSNRFDELIDLIKKHLKVKKTIMEDKDLVVVCDGSL